MNTLEKGNGIGNWNWNKDKSQGAEEKVFKKIQDGTNQILKFIEPKIPFILYFGSRLSRWLKVFIILCLAWAEGALIMYTYLGTASGAKICPCNLGPVRDVPVGTLEIVPDASEESAPKHLTRSQAFRMKPDPK